MKYILVPTDYSKGADNALVMAAEIARRTESVIGVLHAWHIPVSLAGRTTEFLQEDLEREKEAEMTAYEARMKVLLAAGGQPLPQMEFLGVEGFAVDKILEAAADKKADLIVMGTHGASGIEEVFLGTNTADVVRKAACPVLAVPSGFRFEQLRRICYCTDWVSAEEPAIDELLMLAAIFGATLDIVHVVESEFFIPENEAEKTLKDLQNTTNYSHLEVHVLAGVDANKVLENYFETSKPDLVAMLMRRRNFLDRVLHVSKTRKMAMHTAWPLLVFHG
jgi:nucleotide-binding universal stress UspA family protein